MNTKNEKKPAPGKVARKERRKNDLSQKQKFFDLDNYDDDLDGDILEEGEDDAQYRKNFESEFLLSVRETDENI